MRGTLRILSAVTIALVVASGAFAAGSAEESTVPAEPVELVVLSHRVHQSVMEGGESAGKNLLEEFLASSSQVSGVEFITAGTPEVRDRLFREAALPRTDIDVGFVYSPWMSGDIPVLFESLSSFQDEQPIEAFDDIIGSFRDEVSFDGEIYLIPMRAGGGSILFYNKRILAERGIAPPETLEDLVEAIKATTFTRANGEQVYGFAKQGQKAEIAFSMGVFLRAMDGDWVSRGLASQLGEPEVRETVDIFRDLYDARALPPNFTALDNSEVVSLFKNNRVAFTTFGPNYYGRLAEEAVIDQEDIGYINFPAPEGNNYPGAAPAITFQWAMGIPKGSQNKEAAWEFMRFMASRDAIFNMSLSGNDPVRASTYANPDYQARIPYIDEQLAMFESGRPMYPAFDNFAQVNDIIGEELQAAVIGSKSTDAAIADAERRIAPLLQ